MRRPKKFAEGGSADKSKARYDRKVADIESDFEKWKKSGKYGSEGVAKAKYEQRMADAKDDLAKWTKSDRTETRAAEKAAESALSESRRTKGLSTRVRDFAATGDEPLKTKVDTSLAGRVQTKAAAPKKVAPVAKRPAAPAVKKVERKPAFNQRDYEQADDTRYYGIRDMMNAARTMFPGGKPVEKTTKPDKVDPKEAALIQRVARPAAERIFKYSPRAQEAARARMAPQPTAEQRKSTELARLKAAADAPGAGSLAKDRYRYAKETGMVNYAKGGSIDGCAVRGKTKLKRK